MANGEAVSKLSKEEKWITALVVIGWVAAFAWLFRLISF